MKPLELLQNELDRLISARTHSMKSFEEGQIDKDLHEAHMVNLTPMIEEYRYTIQIINKYKEL